MVEVPEEIKDKWYLIMRSKVLAFPDKYPLFRVEGHQIYRLIATNSFSGANSNDWKLMLPKELRRPAFGECHDHPTAAHLGIAKTLGRMRKLYYWPGMKTDDVSLVKECKTCAQVKVSSEPKSGLMGQVKKVSYPFQMLPIDFLGPLPRSSSGNYYIFVVTDCFSKFF